MEISVDNINFFSKVDRRFLDMVRLYNDLKILSNLEVENSKNGQLNYTKLVDGKKIYIHSKYNPENEAEKLIENLDLEGKDFVIFIGVGAGYHVEKFIEKHPNVPYVLMELSFEMIAYNMEYVQCERFISDQCKGYFGYTVNESRSDFIVTIKKLLKKHGSSPYIVDFIGVTKAYKEANGIILKNIKEIMIKEKSDIRINSFMGKEWVENGYMNLKYSLENQNFMNNIGKDLKGKTIIQVAAGPSLSDEIENLKKIKEEGSAYIFAVSSAINALIANDIKPDAIFTYDPFMANYEKVIKYVIDKGCDDIPLIFGTSCNYMIAREYKGVKIPFTTSQDVAAKYLYGEELDMDEIISDGPSIAVLLVEILLKLEAKDIILVGQNLAFRDGEAYEKSIEYMTDEHKNRLKAEKIEVESVYGETIYTNKTFESFRLGIERKLQIYNKEGKVKIYNATKGGAKIQGTEFKTLDSVMEDILGKKIVEEDFFDRSNESMNYSDEMVDKYKIFKKDRKHASKSLEVVKQSLEDLMNGIKEKREKKVIKSIESISKQVKKLERNQFYINFLAESNRVEHDIIIRKQKEISEEKNIFAKGEMIVKWYLKFIVKCYNETNNKNWDKLFSDIDIIIFDDLQE